MRRAIVGVLVALVLGVVGTSQVCGDDGQVAQALSETLRNAQKQQELKGFRINVKVENGVVWMKGSVKSKPQRDKALDLARRVEGVRLVVNDLTVEDAGPALAASTPTPTNAVAAPTAVPTPAGPPSALPVAPTVAHSISQQQPAVAAHPAIQQAQAMGTSVGQVPAAAAPGVASADSKLPVMFVPVPYPAPMPAQQPVARRRNPVPVGQRGMTRMVNYSESAGPSCPPGGCDPEVSYGGGHTSGPICDGGYGGYGGYGTPMPEYTGGYGPGGVVYDEPQMPGYAWPSYASHPNYAALQYPRQYSPMAWPYIGPFYPYPQVPLGWRKVCLEWDDGWWWLDFKSKGGCH